MRHDSRQSRPGRETEAASSRATRTNLTPDAADLADLDARAESLRARFVVQVQVEGDHYRTKVYMTAKSAENAARRANKRGKLVHVSLCQLLPAGVVIGLAEVAG